MGCCFGRTGIVALCAAGIAGAVGLGVGLAGKPPAEAATVRTVAQPEEMDMARMMEEIKKLATPGKPHEQLAQLTTTTPWICGGAPTGTPRASRGRFTFCCSAGSAGAGGFPFRSRSSSIW